tara:strand:- start:4093 stop:4530 length:438 start_codon:yes stop_codon:yes gene_type:complete
MSCTGFDGALAIGTSDGLLTAASFTLVGSSRDASASVNADKADISDRTSAFKNYVAAGIDLEITATISNDESTVLTTLRNACLNRTMIKVGLFASSLAASAEGIAFDAHVFSNDIAQPLTDGQTVSVTFAPAHGGQQLPDWVTLT